MSDMVYKNFSFSTPFLCGYVELKIPILDKDGKSAWPAVFPIERIEEMQRIVGPRHFSAQMMLEYVPDTRVRLDPGALHFYTDEYNPRNASIGDMAVTSVAAYWDPAMGRNGLDGSVCAIVYRDDKTRRVFLHDIEYFRVADEELYPMERQCEMVLRFIARHGVRRIAVETNGIGAALPEILRRIAGTQQMHIAIMEISNHARKSDRIIGALEPVLTTGRMYAHERVRATPLLSEMIGWVPVGARTHDDGLDAVAGAMSVMAAPLYPIGARNRALVANTDFSI